MKGVPGKIFAPMSETYGFALTGALLFAVLFAPVLTPSSPGKSGAHHSILVTWLRKRYAVAEWTMAHRKTTLAIAGAALLITLVLTPFPRRRVHAQTRRRESLGSRHSPTDVSFEVSAQNVARYPRNFLGFPDVTQVVSQVGRPDDGTDVTTFNNIEFLVR